MAASQERFFCCLYFCHHGNSIPSKNVGATYSRLASALLGEGRLSGAMHLIFVWSRLPGNLKLGDSSGQLSILQQELT
jgi:hypothetical protein